MKRWAALLLLAGCSTVHWEKPGVTAEMADADARACAAGAQASSVQPRPQTTVTSSGAVLVTEPTQPVDAYRQMEEGQRMEDCMRKKGYRLKGG
jgi:hypothetical protein